MTKIKGTVGYARRGKECGRIRNRGVFSNRASFVLNLFIIFVFFYKNNGRLRSSFRKCYLRRERDLISFWGGPAMMMRKAVRAWVLIGALVLLPVVCPSDA